MLPTVLACAVCGAGQDPSQGSYVVMSIIISVLPLGMLGGIAWWVIKSNRAAERAERDAAPAATQVEPR